MKSATRWVAAATAALVATGVVLACGPNFPQMLLERRDIALLDLYPRDWVSVQIEAMYPDVTDALMASEHSADTAADIEKREVDPSRWPQLAAMRAAPDGATAYAAGEGLPEATRLYIAGAVEFNAARAAVSAGGDSAARAAAALDYFGKVLVLPQADRAPRATWASYMAGRVQSLMNDPAATIRAISWYQQCRNLALQGLPDPLGLAVASYGEEARIALQAGEVQHAMDLYLAQAARGSFRARNSLGYIASRLVADPDLTVRHVQDPRIQRLWYAGMLSAGLHGYYFAGPDDAPDSWGSRLQQVASVIDRSTAGPLDGLAAIAYSTGRYELAASVADGVESALAALVRAKLALRDGNRQRAADEFATAFSFREREPGPGTTSLTQSAWSQLLAENGVLAMSRSDYAAALASLLEAGSQYWLDAAYVAESVLSLEELEAFAGAHVPASHPPGPDPGTYYWRDYRANPASPAKALRLLLARRQMRAGQFDAALANFRTNDFALDETHPSIAVVAADYVAAVRAGQDAWGSVRRAEALFTAATLAKRFGMELMGYELAPDYQAFAGRYAPYQEPGTGSAYLTPDEAMRLAANPPPPERFHYRGTAYELANRAADNLPARSQAFAAVLCTSLQWSQAGSRMERAQALYQRYRREAAYVAWSDKFGATCEAPDFTAAQAFLWQGRIHAMRLALRPWKIPLAVLAAALLAGCAVWAVRRRMAGRSAD